MTVSPFWNDVKTGRYHPFGFQSSTTGRNGGAGFNLDRVVAVPFVTGKQSLTYSELGIWVLSVATTTTAQHACAVYDCTSTTNPYPNNLVSGSDTGVIDANATGLVTVAVNFTLSPYTMYWICCKRERAPVGGTYGFYADETIQHVYQPYLQSGATGATLTEAHTFPLQKASVGTGAYPSTFYASATVASIVSYPLVVGKISAVA